jgi:predicted RNase H-like HicB family nuclease
MKPPEYLKRPYSRCFIPVDYGYHAYILEFPGCLAIGNSFEDAATSLESNAIHWIAAALDLGQDIPDPVQEYWGTQEKILELERLTRMQEGYFTEMVARGNRIEKLEAIMKSTEEKGTPTITVVILINGNPIMARSATKTFEKITNGAIYHCDTGRIIIHKSEDGNVALAIKLLGTIKENP